MLWSRRTCTRPGRQCRSYWHSRNRMNTRSSCNSWTHMQSRTRNIHDIRCNPRTRSSRHYIRYSYCTQRRPSRSRPSRSYNTRRIHHIRRICRHSCSRMSLSSRCRNGSPPDSRNSRWQLTYSLCHRSRDNFRSCSRSRYTRCILPNSRYRSPSSH